MPKTEEEALGKLSPQDAQAYALWKKRLTKDCDAKAVLSGIAASAAAPVDTIVLSDQLDKKSLVSLPGGSWALLEPGSEPLGKAESRLQGKLEVNGAAQGERDVRVSRDGGTCEVFVFGKSVYKTKLVSSVLVVAARDREVASKALTTRVSFPQRADRAFEVRGPWRSVVEGAHAVATQGTLAKVAKALGVDVAMLRKSSISGTLVSPAGAASQTLAFGVGYLGVGADSLFVSPAVAASGDSAWREAVKEFGVVTHVRTPPWRKEHPTALWSWEGALSTTMTADEATVAYAASSSAPMLGALDDAAAVRCQVARLAVFPRDAGAFLPAVSDAFGSCAVLAATSMGQALLSLDRESVLSRFRASARPQDGYGGWDAVLIQWMEGVWAEGGVEAVPKRLGTDIQVVNAFTTHARSLQDALARSPGSVSAKAWLAREVRPLAGRWAFEDVTPNAASVLSTLQVATRIYDALPEESERVLDALASESSTTPAGLDVLASLEPAFLKRIVSYRSSVAALGAGDLARERFGKFREAPVTPGTLSTWETQASDAKSFRDKELASPATFAATRAGDVQEWVTRALKEGWNAADFASLEKFAALARKKMTCESRVSVIEALECVGDTRFSRKDGSLLAPSYNGRYARASKTFLEAVELAKNETGVRYDLQDDFWDPIWARCDAANFDAKVAVLPSRVRAVVDSSYPQKFDAIRGLEEHLEDCR